MELAFILTFKVLIISAKTAHLKTTVAIKRNKWSKYCDVWKCIVYVNKLFIEHQILRWYQDLYSRSKLIWFRLPSLAYTYIIPLCKLSEAIFDLCFSKAQRSLRCTKHKFRFLLRQMRTWSYTSRRASLQFSHFHKSNLEKFRYERMGNTNGVFPRS